MSPVRIALTGEGPIEVAWDWTNIAGLRQNSSRNITFQNRIWDRWLLGVTSRSPVKESRILLYRLNTLVKRIVIVAMTRKDWQKKRKKMSGREGPKKGKNR